MIGLWSVAARYAWKAVRPLDPAPASRWPALTQAMAAGA
jgi:hypothetical protein